MIDKIDKAFKLIGILEYEVGKILYDIKTSKSYFKYASHIHSWRDFLKEIGLTFGEAQSLLNLVETFPALDESTDIKRLKQIAKIYKFGFIKKDQLEEIKEKASSLTIKDWNDELNMLEGMKSYLGCEHKHFDTYIRCKDCGKWVKIEEN